MNRRSLLAASLRLPFAQRVLAPGHDWPTRSVRIVCPFTPGGSQDNIARRLSVKLSEQFGQSFVVDNRSGAGGSIAADNVAKSPPDGYSVLLGNIGSHALVPHLYAKPPTTRSPTSRPRLDRHPAQPAGCHPDFPHDTPQKLIAAAKASPARYSYGSLGRRHLALAHHGDPEAEDRHRPHVHQLPRRLGGGGRRAGRTYSALHRQHGFTDGPGERRAS
jgi:tripartite-type tricarboxylate transporter receptor subunit TctC